MPIDPRKKGISAAQVELHSIETQNPILTPEILVDTEPQQKAGEKDGLALLQTLRTLKGKALRQPNHLEESRHQLSFLACPVRVDEFPHQLSLRAYL